MKYKGVKFLSILILMTIFLLGCSGNTASTEQDSIPDKTFTIEELKNFNGKDGNPAYVAVDGIVYDMTNLGAWRNGKHNGYEAGYDLTEEIKSKSPHGVGKLKGVPPVGRLAE